MSLVQLRRVLRWAEAQLQTLKEGSSPTTNLKGGLKPERRSQGRHSYSPSSPSPGLSSETPAPKGTVICKNTSILI